MTNSIQDIQFRNEIIDSDPTVIEDIVRSTGYFYEYEIPVARELAEERLLHGIESGYFFIFAMLSGEVAAYSCYGPIACTNGSYDLYWIVTHQKYRGMGIGKKLINETIEAIRRIGGRMLIAETSTRNQYLPTRRFYESNHFICEAIIEDFYEPGDGKAMYISRLT